MSVSRKNKKSNKMKKSSRSSKSSKRSKNVRNVKKTRKHMKKMQGGAGQPLKDVEQVVDYIIYSGNKVLVSPNNTVANAPHNLALIGTFATASVFKNDAEKIKINHSQKESIENAIKAKTTNDSSDLVPLENLNAFLLLEKSLEDKMTIAPIRQYLCTFKPVDGEKFRPVNDDIRLKSNCNAIRGNGCAIFTQLFSVNVEDSDKARKLFTDIPSKELDKPMMWVDLSMLDEIKNIFSGHLKLLRDSGMNFNIGEFGFTNNINL